jgi:PAS domain S-box-containing protein
LADQDTEVALRDRERELSQLVDMVPSHLWRLTPEGEPIFFNKRMVDFLGLDVADTDKPGVSRLEALIETVHPDDAPEFRETLGRCLVTGDRFSMRYRLRRADGVYRWMSSRAEPVRNQEGRVVQWYGLCHDIDDQMRAEEALRRSERQLYQLIDTVPAFIWSASAEGQPSYINKPGMKYSGLTVQNLDVPGRTRLAVAVDTLVHPGDRPAALRIMTDSFATGEPFTLKVRQRRADGAYRWMHVRAEPLRNPDGGIVQWYGVCHDIDDEVNALEELRGAQDQLARATQAASLAELSASIAHEVNQPLAAIVATSYACSRWLAANPPNVERAQLTLERIIRDANSASEVVSRIRALFSQLGRDRSPADMTEIISEVHRLMANDLAASNVRVETELDQSLPPALIDRVQMQQVLVNLIRNAIDAMETIVDGARVIRLRAVLDGDNTVRVEVRDVGAGVKEPERMFEPFFTTKKDGMGMGLTICRSIIEAHDGQLWVTANEPRGTTLAFTLPIQPRDAA